MGENKEFFSLGNFKIVIPKETSKRVKIQGAMER